MSDNSKAIYGLVAAFDSPERLTKAAERVRDAGYRRTDAFTPFPVHGLAEALGAPKSRMAQVMFVAGLVGVAAGILLQWWVSCVAYPHRVSGRPFFSWPNFVPIVFECMVLLAAVTGVVTLLVRCGLPKPYHPMFDAPGFEKASTDRFVLLVKSADPLFDRERTRRLLQEAGAGSVDEVPWEHPGEDD